MKIHSEINEEPFFEDMEKVRLVLTGNGKESVFFKSRSLTPSVLFPGAKQAVGTETRATFLVGEPSSWSEAHIMGLYGASPVATPASEPTVDSPTEGDDSTPVAE